jgi:hypothetical protein
LFLPILSVAVWVLSHLVIGPLWIFLGRGPFLPGPFPSGSWPLFFALFRSPLLRSSLARSW